MRKFMALLGMLAFMITLMPTSIARADTYENPGYTDINDALTQLGLTNIEVNENSKYFLAQSPHNGRYGLFEFQVYDDIYAYTSIVGNDYCVNFDNCSQWNFGGINPTWTPSSYSSSSYKLYSSYENAYPIPIYSDVDIYNEDGTLFFQQTPLTLAKIVEQSSRQASPIRQVIFLVPLGISLVVSFLALRKCLHLLRTILLKA